MDRSCFRFFGARRGKAAVLEVYQANRGQRAGASLRSRIDHAGRDSAASMMPLFADGAGFQQTDQPRLAHFAQFQGWPAHQHPRTRRHLRSGGAGRSDIRSIYRSSRHRDHLIFRAKARVITQPSFSAMVRESQIDQAWAGAMIPRRLDGCGFPLLLAASLSLASVPQAHAQTLPSGENRTLRKLPRPMQDADAREADARDAESRT